MHIDWVITFSVDTYFFMKIGPSNSYVSVFNTPYCASKIYYVNKASLNLYTIIINRMLTFHW